MSVQLTRDALDKLMRGGTGPVVPSVYEMRFVRLDIHDNLSNRNLWVYLGRQSDYLIIPGAFCSCRDFMIRTVINKKTSYCKHQLGVYTAIKLNKYTALRVDIEEAFTIVQETLDRGFSISLRRKLIK